jgi:hypothetical protein
VFIINLKPVIGIGVQFRGLQASRSDTGPLCEHYNITTLQHYTQQAIQPSYCKNPSGLLAL